MSRQKISHFVHQAKIVTGFLFACVAVPTTGHAQPIEISEFGATFGVLAGVTQPHISSYDAATDIYTIEAALGSTGDPADLYPGDFISPIATDFIGTFSLTAIVDETGMLSSGTFSWFGGSASLGIAPDSELLTGALASVAVEQGPSFIIQSFGYVDLINPILGSVVGPVGELLINDFQNVPGWELNPWGSSFYHDVSFTGGPDLLGRPAQVPEPPTLTLLAMGLVGVMFARRRRIA